MEDIFNAMEDQAAKEKEFLEAKPDKNSIQDER